MPFTASSLSAVTNLLPQAAFAVFCKAANEGESAGLVFNDCIRQGWAATKAAGWQAPVNGKKWILVKGEPSDCGDVHVEAPMGDKKKKPKKGDQFETGAAKVVKVDAALGLVFGWAIVCKQDGEEYFDVQGDHIPEDSMLTAACDFMQNSRVAKDMHQGDEVGPIVFCWPMTADIAKSMGIETASTGLMIAMKPSDDIVEKYKSGEYTGFSIGGLRGIDEDVDDEVAKSDDGAVEEVDGDEVGDAVEPTTKTAADAFSLAHEAIKAVQSMVSRDQPVAPAASPAGPMTLNVTVNDPRGATKKTVTTRKDDDGNLTAEVVEAPEEVGQ